MQSTPSAKDFIKKFSQLNAENQRCVLAILQTLTYVQAIEREDTQEERCRKAKTPVP